MYQAGGLMKTVGAGLLFLAALNVHGATLTNTISRFVCSIPETGNVGTNPCDLQGTIPDPVTGRLPYASASVSGSADYGLLRQDISYRADNGGFVDFAMNTEFLDRM